MYFHAFRSRVPVIRPRYSRAGYKIFTMENGGHHAWRERNQFLISSLKRYIGNQNVTPTRVTNVFTLFYLSKRFVESRVWCVCKRSEIYYNGIDTYKIAQFWKSITSLMFRRISLTRISVSYNENEILVCSVIIREIIYFSFTYVKIIVDTLSAVCVNARI